MNVTIPCKVLTSLAQLFIVLFAEMLHVILIDKDRPAHECSVYWNVKWRSDRHFLISHGQTQFNNCASKINYCYDWQSKKVCIKMEVRLFIMHPLCGSRKYPYHPFLKQWEKSTVIFPMQPCISFACVQELFFNNFFVTWGQKEFAYLL